jgi:hypothetical protein
MALEVRMQTSLEQPLYSLAVWPFGSLDVMVACLSWPGSSAAHCVE